LVVYSEYARQELLRNGFDPGRIEVHVPIRCWGTQAPVSSFSHRNLVLYVGQIVRGKGVDVLLESLARVKAPFECLVLGEGNHRRHCERISRKLRLQDRVHFRGFILRQELKDYYLESSVFVVSSLWPEPFGLVGPEAMRYGLPVVAFDAGGIREWLIDGENGYLVPWKNTELYAARVQQLLLDKPLARELGRRGLKRVNEQYNAARQVASLENTFVQVLQEATQSRTAGLSGTAFSE
jgi:glycosyltransferase involved in cell wall biosynthesis